ncbi:universal stress protein [Streptomyces sp. 4N509B]|uniref:universal stress protein n=1 Tax=Streptomyces sp. 4N509B TaxID=3457413 RepID=UPI003FD2C145
MTSVEQPMVVGVDGSESSLLALDWAADEAARHGCALRLVYSSLWERYEGISPSVGIERPEGGMMARNVLAAAEQRAALRQPDVRLSLDVLTRHPVEALIDEGRRAFALVVGSRGRGPLTGMLLGSVSLGVVGRAACPTIVVRGSVPAQAGRFGRLVLGADGEPHSAAAVEFAFREAEVRGCELRAVYTWWRSDDRARAGGQAEEARSVLDEALAEAVGRHSRVSVEQASLEGPARPALLRAAEDADLLVVGAHQRRGAVGLRLGLVSHALLHHAPCPVAVVPQP